MAAKKRTVPFDPVDEIAATFDAGLFGWPCRKTSKGVYPAGRSWLKESPTREAALQAAPGQTHLAVWCGAGTVGLDLDCKNGKDGIAALRSAGIELPDGAPECLTPNGGKHFLFSGDVSGNHEPLPGVEVFGNKWLVMSGPGYSWIKRPAGVHPTLPASLARLVIARTPATPARMIAEGNRNRELTRLAGSLRRSGLTAEEIRAGLIAVNSCRCVPPLADSELDSIAASVGSYSAGPCITPGEVYIPSWTNRPTTPPDTLFLNGIRVGGPGGLVLIVAMPGSGKTNLCGALAASRLNPGADSLGFSTDQDVFIVDTEQAKHEHYDTYFLRTARRAGITEGGAFPGVRFALVSLLPSIDERRTWLTKCINEGGFGLLVIDNLADFLRDANDPGECNDFLFWLLSESKRRDFCIVATIHPNPSGSFDKARGHLGSAAMRLACCVLLLKRDLKTDIRTLSSGFVMGKNRSGASKVEVSFSWDLEHEMFKTCAPAPKGKPKREQEQLTALKQLPVDKRMSHAEIVGEIAKLTGKNISTCKRWLFQWAVSGLVNKDTDGTYSVVESGIE